MKPFPDFNLDPKALRDELNEFEQLLASKTELSERDDILPSFKKWMNLSAYVGATSGLGRCDGLKHEYTFGDLYRADLAVANRSSGNFLLVEFEDARPESIFLKDASWAKRYEHGCSQVVDWLCYLDEQKSTNQFREAFAPSTPGTEPTIDALVVIRRDQYLDDRARRRMTWRTANLLIASRRIRVWTFDELLRQMKDALQYAKAVSG